MLKKIRFVELSVGTQFTWAGTVLLKESSKRAVAKGNKNQSYIFNGNELVSVENDSSNMEDDDYDADLYYPYHYHFNP